MGKKTKYDLTTLIRQNKKLFEALNSSNDLSCILIGASYLDESLGALLHEFSIESSVTDKIIYDNSSILSTLSSKTDITYVLGLVSKDNYNDLRKIAEIRNMVAHSHLSKDFSNEEVIASCGQLNYWKILQSDNENEKDKLFSSNKPREMAKNKWKFTVALLSQEILVNGQCAHRRERKD